MLNIPKEQHSFFQEHEEIHETQSVETIAMKRLVSIKTSAMKI